MTTEEKVRSIVAEQFGIPNEEVNLTDKYIEDLGGDSLDAIEILMQMEEAFNIEIPDEQAEKILTVGQTVDYVTKMTKGVTQEEP